MYSNYRGRTQSQGHRRVHINTHRRVSRTLQSRFFVRIALLLQDWLDVSTTVSCEMARRSPQFSEEVSGAVRARFSEVRFNLESSPVQRLPAGRMHSVGTVIDAQNVSWKDSRKIR